MTESLFIFIVNQKFRSMEEFNAIKRRDFLRNMAVMAGLGLVSSDLVASGLPAKGSKMKLGFVTYQWGKDWDVPTLIKNLSASGIFGVELRVEHKHGVGTELNAEQRKNVKKQFADSPVKIVGMGTNQQYDYPDPTELRKSIDKTKEFILLSRDIGGSGVKVKPNQFRQGITHEKTIEQIGKSLNEIAKYAADYGQQLRLEVHGNETQELPNIKAIMDVADHPNATVCWNCNSQDLIGGGLEYNFNLVKKRFGDICHVRELDDKDYPYQDLMKLFVGIDYKGWVLLECRTDPADKVKALIDQRKIFEGMIKNARNS
jgi:sugar phosphate isomerase/epimerase